MKKSADRAIPFIRQAINAIGDDFSLNDAKQNLYKALRAVEKVGKRRTNRAEWTKKFEEEAKNKHNEWWDNIKKQATKLAEEKLQEND